MKTALIRLIALLGLFIYSNNLLAQEGDDGYGSEEWPAEVYFDPIPDVTFGDASFYIYPWSDDGCDPYIWSNDNSIVVVTGQLVTIVDAGTITIEAEATPY